MDVQMPGMDGYEVTQAIRSGKAGTLNQNVPIIAQTASAMEKDRQRCFEVGMNDYLAKPIYLTGLADVIARAAPRPGADSAVPLTPAIDKAEAIHRLGGDKAIFKEAVSMYLDQIPDRCLELKAALSLGDFKRLAALGHTLKSSSALVGAITLQSMFIALENAGKENSPTLSALLIGQIENEFLRYSKAAECL
jgi:response regulator RpfG family c-di-GMP phosphodiesterase